MLNIVIPLLMICCAPISAFAAIDWAGNFSYSLNKEQIQTIDPIDMYPDDSILFSVEVYKRGVTEAEGAGELIFVRLYLDVRDVLYFPMKYVGDRNNNDLYQVELKPWTLEGSTYRMAVGVTDQDIQNIRHWSEANFYWVTSTSYGYTNPSYPNHEWFNSFRTLKVAPIGRHQVPPFLETK